MKPIKTFNDVMNYCKQNEVIYKKLVTEVGKKSLIPFVGTGLSSAIKVNKASIFPVWKTLLNDLADEIHDETAKRHTLNLIYKGNYELAAEIISDCHGENKLFNDLKHIFNDSKIPKQFNKQQKEESVFKLVDLFGESIILTTNYDAVIERVYATKQIYLQPATTIDMTPVNSALDRSRNGVLFKLHGDINANPKSIIFTRSSYYENYDKSKQLYNTLYNIVQNNILFFVGCSLTIDRSMKVVKAVKDDNVGKHLHLGITNVNGQSVDDRIQYLADIGIEAILYPDGEHKSVKLVFDQLIKDVK